jgi:hypothetical protein
MYFCDNCGYYLEISKSSNLSTESDTRTTIPKLAEALTKLENNEPLTNFKAGFSKDDMIKNKKYQKLSDTDRIKINQLFEEFVTSGAEFSCNNCNLTKQITETTLLYQINMEDKQYKVQSIEDNELICKDPLLPHTHDYTCKNPSCITHKKPELKDSVFLREHKTYKLNYICTVCFFSW